MTPFIILSDIHGNLKQLELLKTVQAKYPKATTIFGGDYIDGFHTGYQVLKAIRKIQQENPEHTVVLAGNHERLLIDYMDNFINGLWLVNGGKQTMKQWIKDIGRTPGSVITNRDCILKASYDYIGWLKNLPASIEYDKFMFVHGGLEMFRKDPRDTSYKEQLWARESYIYQYPPEEHVFAHNTINKTIISGHTPTVYIHGHYDNNVDKGYPNQLNDSNLPCPVKTIQYENEQPRYFIDGGNHSGAPENKGNIIVIDGDTGLMIDKFED